MKKLTLLLFAMLTICSASAQETVKLTVNGQGATKEEAAANALRSAIEQSFGVFVSANTQILNDEVVKDEIATISSGNIQEYKELGCITMPNGQQSVTLSATVSIGNLISYAKSKGSSAEFAGQVFAMNIKMRELNKTNEEYALSHLLHRLSLLSNNLFDYRLDSVSTPYKRSSTMGEVWNCNVQLSFLATGYSAQFYELLVNTLESLSLTDDEIKSYKETNEPYYELVIAGLPSFHPDLTGYSIHKEAKSYHFRNNCTKFSKELYDIICAAIYNFHIEIEGINVNYQTCHNVVDSHGKFLYFEPQDCYDNNYYNKNIKKGKSIGWESFNFYLISTSNNSPHICTTCSGVCPGLWYRPSFNCNIDWNARECSVCIIEEFDKYSNINEDVLTFTFDIPIIGNDNLYKVRKISVDKNLTNKNHIYM